MRVLAIDTALGAASVAIVETDDDAAPAHVVSVAMARGHAEALMPQIRDVLAAGGGLGTVERIAVTVGPGSFTGLRVGLAAARALALARSVPIVGVTTLAALAAPRLAADPGLPVAAAVDARHGRVFFQAFGADGAPLGPARLLPADESALALGGGPALVVGSGANLVIDAASGGLLRKAEGPHDAPDPIWLARLGAACDPQASPPRPLYLKAADAHPQEGGRIPRR